ncbi:MAG TPA: hypothetical protein PLN38_04830 [Chitinophagales bacterium]|nr:hypothetical protein [Chitinophagales bacterium]
MSDFPLILIAAPTAKAKNYCFADWLDNVMSFTYPNYKVVLFDNTPDDGLNALFLNHLYANKYGNNNRFMVINSFVKNETNKNIGIIERLCMSHNDCRDYAMKKGFDYLFHLETDIFPPHDVIERLLSHNKKLVNGLYYSDNGANRVAMAQIPIKLSPINGASIWVRKENELDLLLQDKLVKVGAAGLGCALIHLSVLRKIKFRFVVNNAKTPDVHFNDDCIHHKIPIYIDASVVCSHRNQEWGVYGIDYN